ncbi:MAG TPA: tetratricopeptide repeat protein [Syntrophorhabdus sp.]|jgi:tetratricopeptide (TPR) repeat protein|nr:tetratricopeptide repeat protein [Syntrophorhabdus sp.]HQO64965.1 tetratricopeptide repeat protein [Syntrophorhabdus sp.]
MYRHKIFIVPVLLIFVAALLTAGCQQETTAKDYYQKSFQFINAGNTQDAIDVLTFAIDKDPSFFEAYYNRGVLYYCQEKYQKALDDLNKAVSLNRQNAGAFASRGTVYDKLSKPDLALADFKEAARLGDKETQDYLKSKGIAW